MIRRVRFPSELENLPISGILPQKIRALLLAYGTEYEFCRFYQSEDFTISEQNGSFVVSEIGTNPGYDELAEFFAFFGFTEIFCSERAGEQISEKIHCSCESVNLMRFEGFAAPCGAVENPSLAEVFEVLKTAFDIEFEPWYLDMSHRIRHGVSTVRKLEDSVLAIQHNLNGEALLSQICTLPKSRGKGNATRLIRSVCAELSPSVVFVLCRDELTEFYMKAGFLQEGRYFQLQK